MKTSSFQFTNPVLVNFVLEVNKAFNKKTKKEIDIPSGFNVSIHENEDANEAIVELTVEIGKKDKTMPYYLCATEGAKFKWSEEAKEKKDVLLQQNAPALLLGYIRSIIAMVSSATPFDTINIPFMDFTQRDENN